MQGETRFKMRVVALLKKIPKVHIIKIQQVAKKGDPDIIMCAAGRFVAWELKVGANTATNLQQHQLDLITKAGGLAFVVTPVNLDQHLIALKIHAEGAHYDGSKKSNGSIGTPRSKEPKQS